MEKIRNYSIIIYALVAVAVILSMQFQVTLAEEKDYFSDSREKREILWLARVVYSETKEENEQVLVAWIARNRVETDFKGSTYEEVANSPAQFSGLNPGDKQYRINISRNYASEGEAWKNALRIARAVYHADGSLRPFPKTVRHFYSPKSVMSDPHWSAELNPTLIIKSRDKEHIRFAFYDSVK